MDDRYFVQELRALRKLAQCEGRIAKGGSKWEGSEDGQTGGGDVFRSVSTRFPAKRTNSQITSSLPTTYKSSMIDE